LAGRKVGGDKLFGVIPDRDADLIVGQVCVYDVACKRTPRLTVFAVELYPNPLVAVQAEVHV